MPPPKKPSLYSLDKTHVAFAAAAVILLLGLIWMVLQDSTREWKGWQRQFMTYMRGKAAIELQETQKKVDQEKLKQLEADLLQAKETAKARQSEIKNARKELDRIHIQYNNSKTKYQDLKQFQDSDRYFYEEALEHHEAEKEKEIGARMAEREKELADWKLKLEQAEGQQQAGQAELERWAGKAAELERERTRLEMDVSTVRNKIQKYTPTLAKEILNAPMLDFIQPSLQIQQIVVEKLQDDFYFAKTQKVDRCITCHLGIDQKGLEDAPQPFQSHPKLDLFLSSNSPHKMEEFGCTICHGGSGQSVSFNTAAHTPRSPEQAEAWRKKYNWQPMEFWADKMLPLNHVEASCAQCHTGTVNVPQADTLNAGRKLAVEYGCTGCHKVEGLERWKVGPSLLHVQSKLDSDWIVRWLHNPKEFRASTKMPQIFDLANTSDPESMDKNAAAIAGISAYLMKNSDPVSLNPAPAAGDPDRGKKLIEEVGCLGCHTAAGFSGNHQGPELSGLGSKVKADWLFHWLKDPKHYSAETRMPNLRLSDQEAADIAGFLLQDHNEKFESQRAPYVKPEAVSGLAMSFLTNTMRHEEAQKKLAAMSTDEQLEFVGSKMIAHQGCFGCHDIKGFEDAKPIGTELTQEGSKDLSRFDFGFAKIPHTRQDWIFHKLKEPRIYDEGKSKTYFEKLKMPHFGFTDEQAGALTTFVLSLQKNTVPEDMQKLLTEKEAEIEAGRLLVEKFNCQGCHTLDGKEGGVRSIMADDLGNAPPVLAGEGKKVKEAWLYHFLAKPTPIRPWLHYRMPTFGFHDEELTKLVSYFDGLDGVHARFVADEIPAASPETLQIGKSLFEQLQCIKCHKANPEPGLSASFLAPNLVMAKSRLRPHWVLDWLKDPQALQEGTMMPAFWPDGASPLPDVLEGDADKQIQAIRDYLMVFEAGESQPQPAPTAASTETKA